MNHQQLLFTEPLFYAPGHTKDGAFGKAEDWIDRIRALAGANEWDNASTAPRAIAFLRGEAAEWFHKSLPFTHPTEQEAAKTSFTAFLALFEPRFCSKAAAADISADWHLLRQNSHESVAAFFDRVTATLYDYVRLQPAITAPEANIEAAITSAGIGGDNWDVTAEQRAAVRAAMGRLVNQVDTLVTNTRFQAVTLTVFANGLINPTYAQRARVAIREGRSLLETRDTLVNMERANSKPQPTTNAQTHGYKNGRGNNNNNGNNGTTHRAMATTDDAQEEAAPANAATAGRGRGGRGRGGRGRGGRGRGAPQRAPGQLPPRACYLCPDQWHWRDQCPRANTANAAQPPQPAGNESAGN
jgi:hypothetical protein